MKIVYLARQTHLDGLKLAGRSLVRHLSTEHDVRVCGGVLQPGHDLLSRPVREHFVGSADLADVDVIYMEGGWNWTKLGFDRLGVDIAREFVAGGGVLVVADLDKNEARDQSDELAAARDLIKTQVRTGEMLGHEGVRYLYDQGALEGRGAMRFFVSEMLVDLWLAPALEGIDSLLTGGAVDLLPAGGVAASGHPNTTIHVNDLATGELYPWPWASADEFGAGHLAVIGARISYDSLVDACPDNARWVSNLLNLLVARSRENKTWATPSAAGGSEPGPDLDALLGAGESQQLERKSSFLTPADPTRPVDSAVIQHAVGKSIAALANTDGGHLVIGLADDGTVLGLAADFAKVRGADRDGFERKLVEYCANNLSIGWAGLGMRIHWASRPEGDVAVIEVPRSPEVVHTKVAKKGGQAEQVVYTRQATTTRKLYGPELLTWFSNRPRS